MRTNIMLAGNSVMIVRVMLDVRLRVIVAVS